MSLDWITNPVIDWIKNSMTLVVILLLMKASIGSYFESIAEDDKTSASASLIFCGVLSAFVLYQAGFSVAFNALTIIVVISSAETFLKTIKDILFLKSRNYVLAIFCMVINFLVGLANYSFLGLVAGFNGENLLVKIVTAVVVIIPYFLLKKQ